MNGGCWYPTGGLGRVTCFILFEASAQMDYDIGAFTIGISTERGTSKLWVEIRNVGPVRDLPFAFRTRYPQSGAALLR